MLVFGYCNCCSSFYKYFYGIIPDTIHNIPKIRLKSKYLRMCFYVFLLSLLQLVCAAVGFPFLKKFGKLKFLLLIVYLVISLLGIFGSLFCQIYLFLPHFILDVTYLLVLAALIIFSYLGYISELVILFILTILCLISVVFSFFITHYLWKLVNKYDDYDEKKNYTNEEIIEILTNQYHYLIPNNETNDNGFGNTTEIVPVNTKIIPVKEEEEEENVIQNNSFKKENNNNIKRGICVVCDDNRSCYAILPCGHLCLCEECCKMYQQHEEYRCPLCRLNIMSYTRIYET